MQSLNRLFQWASRLFLRGGSLLLLRLGSLLPLADETSLAASVAQRPVCALVRRVVRDLALLDGDLVADGERVLAQLDLAIVTSLLRALHVLGGGLTSLDRLGFAWEEDETAVVGLQALDVGLERLLRKVLTAGIDRDTDGGCQLAWNTGFL